MKRLHRKKDPADLLAPGRKRNPNGIKAHRKRANSAPAIVGTNEPAISDRARASLEALVGPCNETTRPGAPVTRADCIDGPRPCPWTRCKHHLAIDVTRFGSLRITWPELQIGEILYSCALDVTDANPGGLGLDQIGAICNLTNERVRQIEKRAIEKLAALGKLRGY